MVIQNRQVLIEFNADTENPPRNPSPEATLDLKVKANTVLSKLPDAAENNASVRNLVVTRQGHILMELSSSKGSTWLQKPENETAFLSEFAPGKRICKRSFPIILRFVPIEWTPHKNEALQSLETDLNLKPGDITGLTGSKTHHNAQPTRKLPMSKSSASPQRRQTISSFHQFTSVDDRLHPKRT
jgi:hypothetical protein